MKKQNSSNSSKKKSGNTKQISPAKHWVFTLNNHTPENIKEFMEHSSIKRLSMQEETGALGTRHLQGYCQFVTKKRPRDVFESMKPHWEPCHNIKASIIYTQKEDTRTGKQYLRNIVKIKPIKCLKKDQLYEWQRKIVDMVEEEPDDRSINWFWEYKGSVGKSALVRFLVINCRAVLVSGKSADIKYQIANMDEKPEIIVYDIPRTARNYVNYTALEEIKNGLFCSSKYESNMVIMNPPHVVCFANFEPNYEAMSEDRWAVTELECE